MKIQHECLPCLINQAVRTAQMTGAPEPEALYRRIFAAMSRMDFNASNPEIIGENFRLIKEQLGVEDPYQETRIRYNRRFSEWIAAHQQRIPSMEGALMYAAAANIIDFNPIHQDVAAQIDRQLSHVDASRFAVLDTGLLRQELSRAETLLYLGDNCGEICFDKLAIRRIRQEYPNCQVFYGVRGAPVVNDATRADAHMTGMAQVARVISNGDDSLGTVLSRVSPEFLAVWQKADVVIAKGQANYESLCDAGKPVYYLMTVKCAVIARLTGCPKGSLVCMRLPKA